MESIPDYPSTPAKPIEPIIPGENNTNKKTNENGEAMRIRWKNRRKMAWIALIAMILLMIALLFGPVSIERINTLKEPIIWFFFSMASIIGMYMGATTWASIKGKH